MFHWLQRNQEHTTLVLRAIAAVVLVLILIITSYFLISAIAVHRTVGPLASPRHIRGMLLPAAPPTVDTVAGWMTFEYLNRVFRLPTDALKTALNITDTRYPRLSIHRWATGMNLDQATALEQVKQAIRNAQMPTTK